MAETPRGKAFDEHEPKLTEEEIADATGARKIALSLCGKPVLASPEIVGLLAVKFALMDGTCPIVLLDRLAAAALQKLIQAAEEMNWKTDKLKPSGVRH